MSYTEDEFVTIARSIIRDRDEEIARKDAEIRELQHEATHDKLTGLLNRRALFEYTGPWAVCTMIDVNGLKSINDNEGHAAGDTYLLTVASRLAREARIAGGTVYRIGGDEFVMLSMLRPDMESLLWAHASVRRGAQAPVMSLAEAMDKADVTMYALKRAQKSRVRS